MKKYKVFVSGTQKEHWSTRTLSERIGSMLYERTALTKLPSKKIFQEKLRKALHVSHVQLKGLKLKND